MYMGVIPLVGLNQKTKRSAPHVYGGDPEFDSLDSLEDLCSPCIWG